MTANNTGEVETSENEADEEEGAPPPSDRANMALLILLYCLQGIPLGVSNAIPMILASRNVNYTDQAVFSFAGWPFSLKLLWAPVLDSIYITSLGRRKSWLIPAQFFIGLTMLYVSYTIDRWMTATSDGQIEVVKMAIAFFLLNFLSATQDIAVDGWALTILHRKNIGHAATCNAVGETGGFFLGYILLTALESPNFCNTYLRSSPQQTGVVTISNFLFYLSFMYILTTSLVALFKHEKDVHTENTSLKNAYLSLFAMLKLRPIQWFAMILLTIHWTNAPIYSVVSIKMVQAGVSQEKIALSNVPLIPINMFVLFMVSRWAAGSNGLIKFMWIQYLYLIYDFVTLLFIWYTPVAVKDGVPMYFWGLLLVNSFFENVLYLSGDTALVAFFAKVSDPRFGATYMTLFNTLFNFGGSWPRTLVLGVIDYITWKTCQFNSTPEITLSADLNVTYGTDYSCSSKTDENRCLSDGGVCEIIFDGYFVISPIIFSLGCVWLLVIKSKFYYLQSLDPSEWRLSKTTAELPLKRLSLKDLPEVELLDRRSGNKIFFAS